MSKVVLLWGLAILIALPIPVRGEVVRVVVDRREDVLRGRSFGSIGPYEKIVGRVFFAFDPGHPVNARIADIDKAPRNGRGVVEAWANFMVLRPKFPPRTGRVALLEVSNRGGKAALSYFNGSLSSQDPVDPEHFGDGLLMRLGLTIIWVGWQHDVPPRPGLLSLHVPIATEGGDPLFGLARSDWTVDVSTTTLALGHRDHLAYPVAEPDHPENVLTVRAGRLALRRPIPRRSWAFAREEGGEVIADSTSIYMDAGFQAGSIYELVYRVKDPRVVGLGLAAVRDMMSYAKYDSTGIFRVEHGIGVGLSQAGRFLRHFIYEGFNTDEQGRRVFDGLMVHTAGAGRGSFNHRFAQPSRDAHRYSSFFYPTDLFPFTSRTQADSVTGITNGLFARLHDPAHLPKIFYTNTGYEYWGRAAALIHTTVNGKADIELFPNERIYHLASAQHSVGRRFPPSLADRVPGSRGYRGNPLNFMPTMRALLTHMVQWVRTGAAPPPSAYPRIDVGTLTMVQQLKFPRILGVDIPKVAHEAYRADYGPRWNDGIIDFQPPVIGEPFLSLVPQVDEYGNERGGVPSVETLAPLASYASWNLRVDSPGGKEELRDFLGTYIPLSRSEVERRANTDPRPSIEPLYADKADYLQLALEAARALVEEGWLLEEDVSAVLQRAEDHWDWLLAN
jgi:hypothetical protein